MNINVKDISNILKELEEYRKKRYISMHTFAAEIGISFNAYFRMLDERIEEEVHIMPKTYNKLIDMHEKIAHKEKYGK